MILKIRWWERLGKFVGLSKCFRLKSGACRILAAPWLPSLAGTWFKWILLMQRKPSFFIHEFGGPSLPEMQLNRDWVCSHTPLIASITVASTQFISVFFFRGKSIGFRPKKRKSVNLVKSKDSQLKSINLNGSLLPRGKRPVARGQCSHFWTTN